ncbi:hypothetical protein B0H13DRAFT_2505713, partial [Mycena leptocephala]
ACVRNLHSFFPDLPSLPSTYRASLPEYTDLDLSQMESNISVNPGPLEGSIVGDMDNAAAQVQMVKLWLSRSGCCPVSIQGDEYIQDNVDIIPVILPYSARWEHVKLHIDLSDLPPIQRLMPLLRELDLQAPFDCVPAFPAAFYEVPRLRVATLGFPLPHHPVTVVATDFVLTLRAKLPSQCLRITGPRSVSRESYWKAFLSIPKLLFKKQLVDWNWTIFRLRKTGGLEATWAEIPLDEIHDKYTF